MKKIKISLILNLINFAFVVFATIAMMTGFYFMTGTEVLSSTNYKALQFFTVDSNLLAGAVAIVMAIFEILLLKNKINAIPKVIYILKLVATVGVGVTMFTVLFFLGPTMGYGFMFVNSNLFFHLLVPLLSIIGFVFFENTQTLKRHYAMYGILPVAIYSIYYIGHIIRHLDNGKIGPYSDWYGFAQGGSLGIAISCIVMFVATYLLSLGLYFLNRKLDK